MITSSFLESVNQNAAKSRFGRYFRLEGSGAHRERPGSKFTTELRAGLTTFVTMAYIISVNAMIVTDSGGTCVCQHKMSSDLACSSNPEYVACLAILKRDLITATAGISCLSSFLVGVFANLPISLAPGMGLNVYFTYTVVGFHGSGKISYETALAAVFIEGLLFMLLSILGIRQWLARLIPNSIRIAAGAGIGLFLCFIGMQASAGIGLIGGDPATLVTLTGCVMDRATGACLDGTHMRSPTTWIGIFGFMLISICLLYRVKGAVLIGMILISILSWIRGTPFTYFPDTPVGNEMFEYFKQIVNFHPVQSIVGKMNFQLHRSEVWIALITLLYVDVLDCTGTMYSMAKFGGFMYKNGDFDGSGAALLCDAASISIGACFGLPPVTAFIESGAGIVDGGRTGITAIVTAVLFFISLFFSPIFASFPPWATGPALIIVGCMMAKSMRSINWSYIGDAIPAFLTIALMPLSYSIAFGLIAGVASYVAINGFVYVLELVSQGRIIPPDKDLKESWGHDPLTLTNMLPPWVQRLTCWITGQVYVDPLDVMEEEERLEREAATKSLAKTEMVEVLFVRHS